MLRLVVQDYAGNSATVPVGDEVTIGRADHNVVCLTERNVSREHARLVRSPGVVYIEDLDSYNGVFVNGSKISGRAMVRDRDRIVIGDYVLSVVGAPGKSKVRPAPGKTLPGPGPQPGAKPGARPRSGSPSAHWSSSIRGPRSRSSAPPLVARSSARVPSASGSPSIPARLQRVSGLLALQTAQPDSTPNWSGEPFDAVLCERALMTMERTLTSVRLAPAAFPHGTNPPPADRAVDPVDTVLLHGRRVTLEQPSRLPSVPVPVPSNAATRRVRPWVRRLGIAAVVFGAAVVASVLLEWLLLA